MSLFCSYFPENKLGVLSWALGNASQQKMLTMNLVENKKYKKIQTKDYKKNSQN